MHRHSCNQCDCLSTYCVFYLFALAFKLDFDRQTFLGWTHAATLSQFRRNQITFTDLLFLFSIDRFDFSRFFRFSPIFFIFPSEKIFKFPFLTSTSGRSSLCKSISCFDFPVTLRNLRGSVGRSVVWFDLCQLDLLLYHIYFFSQFYQAFFWYPRCWLWLRISQSYFTHVPTFA